MTQAQFLLLLIALTPLVNCSAITLFDKSQKLVNLVSKISPMFFLSVLIGFFNSEENANLEILKTSQNISFGFLVDKSALTFLLFLNLIWIIFAFYSNRFLQVKKSQNANSFKLFFALIIALIILIIISKNIITTLLFYNCLIFLCHFFAVKFLYKKDSKLPYSFTFLLYLESIFFSLGVVATYKFTGQIEFIKGEVISAQLDKVQYLILVILYSSGLFLSVLLPNYFCYRDINFNPLKIYSIFLLAYAFSSLCIFIKFLIFIFGISAFGEILSNIGFIYFEWAFLINFSIACALLLFSKNLKESFFYLFFSQFIFALFAILTFIIFNKARIYLPLFSFFLSFTLAFLCISNIVLYLSKAEDKSLQGLFYELKVTCTLLAFAILNMMGIVPALGMLEKFFLIEILFQKELSISGILFVINFVTLAIFAGKTFLQLLRRSKNTKSEKDLELARVIDFDSSLILTPLIVAVIIFLSPIFIKLMSNFFSL